MLCGSLVVVWGSGIEMTETVETLVIGAGIVGLACARQLALQGQEVLVLESAGKICHETSSRNSEVIHAGIYYKQGSLKADYCVSGKQKLYDYCESHGVKCNKIGKLVVACEESELEYLQNIQQRGAANGVADLKILDKAQLQRMEPELNAIAALWSPSTGILDTHSFALALQGDLEAAGGTLVLNSKVKSGQVLDSNIKLHVQCADEVLELQTKHLVLCGGLYNDDLLKAITGIPAEKIPQQKYCKGSYFKLAGKSPFQHLIYPLPTQDGLGIHSTLDLSGITRFGPDTQWVDKIDYDVDPNRAKAFKNSIARYWPEIEKRELIADYAGIRPKIYDVASESILNDFLLLDQSHFGTNSLIALMGIESPGITASLALAEWVGDRF